MAAEEVGAAAGPTDIECARCDEKDDDEEIANDSCTADSI